MNIIKKIINWIDEYFSEKEKEQINKLKENIKELNETINYVEMEKQGLLEQLEKETELNELEIYWNEKRPHHENYQRLVRTIPKIDSYVKVDPRVFLNPKDNSVPFLTEDSSDNTNDQRAYKCLQWVHKNIKYTDEMTQFKEKEEWLFPFETMSLRKGDCEDGAILLANMMLKAGIPYWRIRLNAGDVKGGGHAYVTYLREKDNKWIILDWCYWYSSNGRLWKNAKKYFGIWFSWNTKYIFYDEKFDRSEV